MATLLKPPPHKTELSGGANNQQSANASKASKTEAGDIAGVTTCPYHHCPHHGHQAHHHNHHHHYHSSDTNAEMGSKAAKSDGVKEATVASAVPSLHKTTKPETQTPPAAVNITHVHGINTKQGSMNYQSGKAKSPDKEMNMAHATTDSKLSGKSSNKGQAKGVKRAHPEVPANSRADGKGGRKTPVIGSGDADTLKASSSLSRPSTPEMPSSQKPKEDEHQHSHTQPETYIYTTEESYNFLKPASFSGHNIPEQHPVHHHATPRSDSFFTTEESHKSQSSPVNFPASHHEHVHVHEKSSAAYNSKDQAHYFTTEESFQLPKHDAAASPLHVHSPSPEETNKLPTPLTQKGVSNSSATTSKTPEKKSSEKKTPDKSRGKDDKKLKSPSKQTSATHSEPPSSHGDAKTEGNKTPTKSTAPAKPSPPSDNQIYTTEESFRSPNRSHETEAPKREDHFYTTEDSYRSQSQTASDENVNLKSKPNKEQFFTTEESHKPYRPLVESQLHDFPEHESAFESMPPPKEDYSYTTEDSYRSPKSGKQTVNPEAHSTPHKNEPVFSEHERYKTPTTPKGEEAFYTTEQSFRFTPEKLFLTPEKTLPHGDAIPDQQIHYQEETRSVVHGDMQATIEKAIPVVHMYHMPPGQTDLPSNFIYTPVEPSEKPEKHFTFTPDDPNLPPEFFLGKKDSSADQPIHSILPQKVPSSPEKVYLPEDITPPEKKLSTPEKPQSKEVETHEEHLTPSKKESTHLPTVSEKDNEGIAVEKKMSEESPNVRDSMMKTETSDTYGLGLPSSSVETNVTRETHSGEQNFPLSEGYEEVDETELHQSKENFLEAQNRHLHFEDARTSSPILDTYSDDSMPRLVDDNVDVNYSVGHLGHDETLSGSSLSRDYYPDHSLSGDHLDISETSPGKKGASGRENIFILPEDQVLFNMEDEPDPGRRHDHLGYAHAADETVYDKRVAFDSTFDSTSHSQETSLGLDLSGLDETFESIPEEAAAYSPQMASTDEVPGSESDYRMAVSSKPDLTPEDRRAQKLHNKSEESVGTPMNVSPPSIYG